MMYFIERGGVWIWSASPYCRQHVQQVAVSVEFEALKERHIDLDTTRACTGIVK